MAMQMGCHREHIFLTGCAFLALIAASSLLARSSPSPKDRSQMCRGELLNANRSLAAWAETTESMINESKLPSNIQSAVHDEANAILDMVEEFAERVKTHPANELAKDLVMLRRRSNKMALQIYISTFDMRWPQTSMQLGVLVDRVQQACLDRGTIDALEAPMNPLEILSPPQKSNRIRT